MTSKVMTAGGVVIFAPGRMNFSVRHPQVMQPALAGMFDALHGGPWGINILLTIAGVVDTPVSRSIGLFDEKTKRLIRFAWSGVDGLLTFSNLNAGPWSLIAWDGIGPYNAVVASNILLPLNQDLISLRFNDTGSVLHYWNGATWVSGRLKRWDGSEWVLV